MTDSRLSSGVSTYSARAQSGGKIIAQNPALLQMLREKTLEREKNSTRTEEEPLHRLYVESPVFTKEDEENIKFVSTEIDEDLRDSLEDGNNSVTELREPDSVSDMPTLHDLISKTEVLKSRQNTNASQFSRSGVSNPSTQFDSSRYEDLEKSQADKNTMLSTSPKKKNSVGHVGQEKVWHTLRNGYDSRNTSASVKSVNFRDAPMEIPDIAEDAEPDVNDDDDGSNKENAVPQSTESSGLEPPSKSDSKVITPIANPLRPVSKEQTEELYLLEEEERYQKEMQTRIEDATQEVQNIHIPKLDLDEVVSDDDDQKVKKQTEMGLLDSLNSTSRTVENEHTLRDSLEQPSGNAVNWEKKYAELEQRLGNLENSKDVAPSQQQQHPENSSARRMTSNDLKNLQNPAVNQKFAREFDYVPEDQYFSSRGQGYIPAQQGGVYSQGMDNKQQPGYRGNLPLNFGTEEQLQGQPPVVSSGNSFPQEEEDEAEPDQYYGQPQRNYGPPPPTLPQQPEQPYVNTQYEDPQFENYQPQYQGDPAQLPQFPPQEQPPYQYQEQYAAEPYANQQQYPNQQAPVDGTAPVGDPNQPSGVYKNGHQPKFIGYRDVDTKSPPAPGKDYIVFNKKALRGEVGSAKTYGKQYHQKKEYSDRPPPQPPIRKKKPVATPAVAANVPSVHSQPRVPATSGTNSTNHLPPTTEEPHSSFNPALEDDENLSPEQRWAKRAQVLAKEKERKLNKPQSKASLRKYDSASKVDDIKHNEGRQRTYNVSVPPSLQGSAAAHHRQTPSQGGGGVGFNPASPPKQAFQEMPHGGISTAKTYTVENGRTVNGQRQPVAAHSLVTGDGQKMNVDINLKVLNNQSHPATVTGGGIAGSRTVSQGRPPMSQPLPQNQYGHESPLQIQSVNSSAGTVRQSPVVGGYVVQQGYAHPQTQPLPPQNGLPYNGPGYHYPSSQPQHYQYSQPPERVIQNGGQGDHYQQQPYAEDPRFGPRQPHHPGVFGPVATGRPIPQARAPVHTNKQQPLIPTQPMQAFQPFQESFDHYHPDQAYNQPEYFEESGVNSPSSFRGGYDNTPTPGNMSPYKLVPPIGSAEESHKPFTQYNTSRKDKATPRPQFPDEVETYGGSHRSGGGGGGSYMDTFEKNKTKKQAVTYKPYTLHDYRKMKKEVRLGGLGPDLDRNSVKEKKEKLQRQLNYAKSINERNRDEYEMEKVRPRPETYTKEEEGQEEDDVIDKRRLALEYAKSVPKPKIKQHDQDEPDSSPSSASRQRFKFVTGKQTNTMKTVTTLRAYPPKAEQQQQRGGVSSMNNPTPLSATANQDTDSALIDLDALQQRHQQEREKVAMIRQNMQVS